MKIFTRLLSIAIVFMLLVTPKNMFSQTVYPGDVNNNGIVNGIDALYWSEAVGATGTIRPNATTDFIAQNLPIPLWNLNFANGLNYAYADCDGNGIVDELDFLDGIIENCENTHGTITPDEYFNGTVGIDPSLCLDPESTEVYSGETLNIDISLGDEDIDIEDFKGITFTLSYDSEFVEDNNDIMLDMTESWADPSGTGEGTVAYAKTFDDIETGEVSILRTASSIQDGQGKIGRVSIIIEDQIVGLITNDTLTVKVMDIKMIDASGTAKRVAPDCEVQVKILEPRSSNNCPQIVNPVCGDDGVTYINCCYAAAAGVTNFTTGVCYSGCIDETQMDFDANCSYTYNPVCGCNDVTYLNSCVAQAYGVTTFTQGACTENCYDPTYVDICGQTSTDPVSGVINVTCPQISDPVCGCDGITYTNSCFAQASGMSFYTPGSCANNCVDPNSMDPNLICASEYEPVCGCNGVSYSNSCYADAAGVLNYTTGSCGSSSWCSTATPISCGDFLPNETSIGLVNNINSYPGCTSQGFAGPDKVYVINKNTSGDLQIGLEIMTPGMDLDMFLLTDDCNQVSCVKSSTTSNVYSNNEGIIFEDAPIGTYYLVIDGQYAASAGDFRLEVNCGYLNCDNSVNLTCGVPVSLNNSTGTDEVSLYGCDGNILNVENNGPEMIHTFTTTTAGPVNVSLYGLTSNLELFMLRSCDRGDCIDYSQNPGTSNEEIEAFLQPGTYYVVVDGYNGAVCDYNLLVSCASNCDYDINATAMEANCGQNNGSINISSTGGDPGFIIQWDGPVSGSFSTYGTNCTVSGLPGGTYNITAIDANGCEDTAEVVIGNSETNLNVSATGNDAVCMDQGSIAVSIVNGSPYYQIFISGPTSGSTTTSLSSFNIVNLDPGTYTLQIVDANGCSNTQEVVVGQSPGNFDWTYTVTDAACGGTGSIHVATQNGSPSYNIIVAGPNSGSATTNYSNFNLNNLPGGTYTITVEDDNWCQVTQTVIIEDSNLTIGLDEVSGFCGGTGSIDVNMSNGAPGYGISWSGPTSGTANVGASSYTIPNLISGSYAVTVTDAAGCSDYQVVTLFNSVGGIDFDLTANNGSCGQPGSIWLGVTSGNAPYTIMWSGAASGTITTPYSNYDIPWLPDGTYSVQVTDADGCSSTDDITINNSMNNLEINTTPNDGICDQPGSIWVSISNGTPGYSITWSGPASGSTTTNTGSYDIPNLPIGIYNITITDGGGCQVTTTAEVGGVGSDIVVTGTPVNGACGSAGGIDLVIDNGASGAYTVTWSGTASGTANTNLSNYSITGLGAGSYVINVTDGNTCTATTNVVVGTNTTSNLVVSGTGNNGICGTTGFVDINISGGTSPYGATWSGAGSGSTIVTGTTFTIPNAASGSYNVVITDASGCIGNTSVVVSNTPSTVNVTANPNNGSCGNTGSIDLTLSGGNGGYAVSWTGASQGTGNANGNSFTITNATQGNYNITVTDGNGCSSTTSTAINNGGNNFTVTGVSADGTCNTPGSLWIFMDGGTPNYLVEWDGPVSGSAPTTAESYDVQNTPAGTYLVTVTDANGCVATTTIVVGNAANGFTISGVSADGTCDGPGSLWIYMDGGVPNYLVEWDGPISGSAPTTAESYDVQNTPAGTYVVTVTDANGCVATTTVVVNSQGSDIAVTGTANNGACGANGSVVLSITGGTSPYAVAYNGAATGNASANGNTYTLTGAASGSYNFTITDAAGCSATTSVAVNNGANNIAVTGTANNGSCGTAGSAVLTITGGTSPYAVSYSGAATGSATANGGAYTLTGAGSGAYNFTITDAAGCTATTSVVVNNNGGNASLALTPTNGSCGTNGEIQVVPTGTAPFTITWTGTGSGSNTGNGAYTITNAAAGNYTVSVVDANGCSASGTTTISSGSTIVATSNATAADCASGAGSIDVTVAAGTPSYTVDVTGPTASTSTQFGNNFTLSGVAAGNYNITITDAAGCATTITEVVGGTGCCMTANMTGVDAECGTNGSIWIDVFSGTTDYTVTWTGASSGTNSIGIDNFEIPNLPGGAYSVTVEGADGCTVTQNVTVNSTGGVTVTATGNDGVCGGNGSANITVTGGTAAYGVTWAGATTGSNTYNAGSFTVPNLPAGSYTFTVTDGNGCTGSQTVTINGGANTLTATSATTAADCTSGVGAVTITVGGGTAGYTVTTTGPTASTTTQNTGTFTLGSLAPGSYDISISDANGCSTSLTALVGGPGCCMTTTMTGVDATCGANGSIWIDVFSGAPDYTVTWTGPSSGSNTIGIDNFEIPNLPGGTYTITVTGNDGCAVTQTVNVNATGGVDVTLTPVDGDCGANGSIWVDVNAGTPGYTVSWTGPSTGTNTTSLANFEIPNLPAGTYSVTILDANNCPSTSTVIVTSGSGTITATTSSTAADCATGLGSIAVNVSGGTAGYTVTTTGPTSSTTTQGGNNFTLSGLAAGNYTISIADANGCNTIVTTVVGGPGCCMTATMTGVDAGCGVNGSIWIDVLNGDPIYTVSWVGPSSGSNTTNLNNFEIPNLPGGMYTITLVDSNNCTVTQTVTVDVSGTIDITATATPGACGTNGSVNVTMLSGTAGYTVAWAGPVVGSNTTNSNNFTIPNLPAGNYTITVTDADGCADIETVNVATVTNTLTASAVGGDVSCTTGLGQIAVSIANGTPGYTVTVAGPTPGTTTQTGSGFNLTGLSPGNYTITITDTNGCSTTTNAIVTDGLCCLTTGIATVNGTCGNGGSITLTSSDGTGPYTYTWTGGGTATSTTSQYTINNVAAGTYTIVVTDANGCVTTNNATITTTPAVTFTATSNDGTCGALGSVDLTILTGTPGYTITYNGGSTTSNGGTINIPNLAASAYLFTVTDANGCSTSQTVAVFTGANNLSASAIGGNASCDTGLGQIAVNVANGTPNYTVTVAGPTPGTTTQVGSGFNLTGLLPGNYTITITDADGCSTTVGATVTDDSCCIMTTLTAVNGTCTGSGSIIVSIANGTPDYTITYTGGGSVVTTTSPYTITGLGAGGYTVNVVDANGCSTNGSVTISTIPDVNFTATGNNGACGAAGSADITILGGTPGYTIAYGGNSIAATGGTTNIPNLAAGTYNFNVTDANGCSAVQTVVIATDGNNLSAAAVGGNADCTSGLGQIAVNVVNGAVGYTVTVAGPTPGTTTQTANGFNLTGLAPGNYTVTIVDANGCSTTVGATVTDTSCCMTSTLSGVDGTCGSAGSIVVAIANGTSPYTITYTGGGTVTSTASLYTINIVPAGTFAVTVVDANGCTTTGNVTISTPPNATFSAVGNAGACGAAGSADITILTGTGPYLIQGAGITVSSNGGTTNIPNLAAGAYPFTVTDVNGCTATQVIQVLTGANDLTATAIGSNADCTTGLGHISIAVTNGVPGYTVAVVGPTSSTTTSAVSAFNLNNLLPGNYTVTITDTNGCATTVGTTIGDGFCCFTANAVVTAEANCGAVGSIDITTASGTSPYTITYTGGASITTAGPNYTITGLAAGSYTITIEDAAGCDVTTTVTVGGGSAITATATGAQAACPSGLGTITGTTTGVGPFNVVIAGVGSTTVPASPFTLTSLLAGTYSLTITDANGCVTTVNNVTILPADACCITANFVSTAATCDAPGEVCVEVFNGLADFTATYNATGSGSIVSSMSNFCVPNLAAGSYNITVTDAAGCEVVETVVVADGCCISDACFASTENGTAIDFASIYTSATATYVWDFGDGSTGTGANPSHTFPGTGNYEVCVEITDDCGTGTCCQTVAAPSALGNVVILRTGEASGGTGTTVSVPVTSENCDMLTSFSASLVTCDDNIAQIVGITPAAINPAFNATNNTFTYFDFNGQGVPCEDVVLFYIDVLLVGTGGQSCDVSITCAPMPCEVGGLENGTGVEVDYILIDGSITIYTMFRMNGMVRTFWLDGVMDAQVQADGTSMNEMDMTDVSGAYLFPELIGDEEYIVKPEKDTLPANGLSTFALYIGQQFILGMDPVEIESPYQVIAGDANCNNSFTALDLFLIQQMIIGTATEFPSCPSWVFVNEDHPLPSDFNTYNVFPYADSDTLQLDQDSFANFVGVKVGDILGNANPQNKLTLAADTRSRNDITFNALNGSVRAGETFTLDFTSSEFEDFVSFQMALDFDMDKMKFVDVIANQDVEMANLISGVSARKEDQVRFSWFNLNGQPTSLKAEETAFSVTFEATRDIADLSELFAINMFDTFNAEAHNQYSEPFNIVLEFVNPEGTSTEIANGDYKLLQNIPNPFISNTTIRFELPEAMKAKLVVTNTLGQVVAEFANEYPKGISQVEWKRNDLPSGLYNYTLTTDSFSATRSMIIID